MKNVVGVSFALLGVGAVIGLITFVLKDAPSPQSAPIAAQQNTPLIDEMMETAQAIQFDENGQIKHILKVKQWHHYQGAPTAEWYYPELSLISDKGTWSLTAHRGTSSQHSLWGRIQEMHLSQQIVVQHTTPVQERDWWLTTDYLLLLPEQQLAQTATPVTVEGPGMQMQSQGLKADFIADSITFMNRVQSQYIIPKKIG